MVCVNINGALYHAKVEGRVADREWGGRESKAITLPMTYDEAVKTFVDGLEWSIVNQQADYVDENGDTVTPEPIVYDNSDYSIAGAITDHRNGTITVKMGKPTEIEILQAQLANAVTEEELETAYVEGVNSL